MTLEEKRERLRESRVEADQHDAPALAKADREFEAALAAVYGSPMADNDPSDESPPEGSPGESGSLPPTVAPLTPASIPPLIPFIGIPMDLMLSIFLGWWLAGLGPFWGSPDSRHAPAGGVAFPKGQGHSVRELINDQEGRTTPRESVAGGTVSGKRMFAVTPDRLSLTVLFPDSGFWTTDGGGFTVAAEPQGLWEATITILSPADVRVKCAGDDETEAQGTWTMGPGGADVFPNCLLQDRRYSVDANGLLPGEYYVQVTAEWPDGERQTKELPMELVIDPCNSTNAPAEFLRCMITKGKGGHGLQYVLRTVWMQYAENRRINPVTPRTTEAPTKWHELLLVMAARSGCKTDDGRCLLHVFGCPTIQLFVHQYFYYQYKIKPNNHDLAIQYREAARSLVAERPGCMNAVLDRHEDPSFFFVPEYEFHGRLFPSTETQ